MTFKSKKFRDVDIPRINEMTGPELASLYREMTGSKVSKFRDRATGIRRVVDALKDTLATNPKATEAKTSSGLAQGTAAKAVGLTSNRRKRFNLPPGNRLRGLRTGTKRTRLVEALERGTTFEECQRVTGWSYKVTYENIYLLNAYTGFGLSEGDDGVIRLVRPARSSEEDK